jgi:hypothetical protein
MLLGCRTATPYAANRYTGHGGRKERVSGLVERATVSRLSHLLGGASRWADAVGSVRPHALR